MTNEIKILLTINLEGGTLVRKIEPDVLTVLFTKRDLNPKKQYTKDEGKQIVKKQKVKYYGYETKPVVKHTNLTKDAYDYMISKECPVGVRIKQWNKMSNTERLEWHLQKVCDHSRGKSFTYQILED